MRPKPGLGYDMSPFEMVPRQIELSGIRRRRRISILINQECGSARRGIFTHVPTPCAPG